MSEMKSLTLNDNTYDSFVDGVARPLAEASAVSCSVSGESIALSDSSDMPLAGLNLYGKSTQAGTPTPDAPVDVVSLGDDGSIKIDVCGKNLLQINKSAVGVPLTNHGITFTRNADDSITINGTASGNAFYNMDYEGGDVKYPTKTRLVANLGGVVDGIVMVVGYFDNNGSVVDNVVDVRSWKQSVEFELPTSAKRGRSYLMVADGTTLKNVVVYPMIRLAKFTENTFEPHKAARSMEVETPEGLKAIPVTDKAVATYTDANGQMWCADEVDLARGVRVKRVKTLELNGTESWGEATQYPAYSFTLPSTSRAGICTHFQRIYYNDLTTGTKEGIYLEYSAKVIAKVKTTFPTLAEFKSFLAERVTAGNPVTIYYCDEAPIETPLTDEQIATYKMLYMNKPNTTVTNDENAYMGMTYIADTKSYIDSKISAGILAATVE